jgi:hypothetical protein
MNFLFVKKTLKQQKGEISITYINIASYFTIAPDCGVGGTSTGTITHLVINVENDELYFTIDRIIIKENTIK